MVNKKGFVRTIEALIAVLILLIFIFTVLPKQKVDQSAPDNIKLIQEKITGEIESNTSLRNDTLSYPVPSTLIELEQNLSRKRLTSFITNSIKNFPTIDFNYTVCDSTNVNCAPDFLKTGPNRNLDVSLPNKNVYAKSAMIANATAERVFRLYLWETF